jgi:hypothetical protein
MSPRVADDQLVADREAGSLVGVLVAPRPQLRHRFVAPGGAAEQRDPARADADQELGRHSRTSDVVHEDVVEPGGNRSLPDQHDRRVDAQLLEIGRVARHDAEHEPVVTAQPRRGQRIQLCRTARPRPLHHQPQPVGGEPIRQPRGELGEVPRCEGGHRQPDRAGAAHPEVPSGHVDLVAELRDGRQHAPLRRLADALRTAVDHVRHRHRGHTGAAGDIGHRHPGPPPPCGSVQPSPSRPAVRNRVRISLDDRADLRRPLRRRSPGCRGRRVPARPTSSWWCGAARPSRPRVRSRSPAGRAWRSRRPVEVTRRPRTRARRPT